MFKLSKLTALIDQTKVAVKLSPGETDGATASTDKSNESLDKPAVTEDSVALKTFSLLNTQSNLKDDRHYLFLF